MKEKIYTIPVNEAFEQDCECPFCILYEKLDEDAVNFMLGPSYMEDTIRLETNKIGFCESHFNKMYKKKNLLGLGLITETHISDIIKNIENLKTKNTPQKKFLSKNCSEDIPIISYLDELENSCYLCNTINKTFALYVDTFLYLYKKDNSMKEKVLNSKGFCLTHFKEVLKHSYKVYSNNDYEDFKNTIVELQTKNLSRLKDELELFTNKFDYKYNDVPYGTSKDSIPRAINKICSTKINKL